MNLEKINDEYFDQNFHKLKRNKNFSTNNKVNILNKNLNNNNNNIIQKDHILKLLKTNDQIYKSKPNISKLDIHNIHTKNNEQLLLDKEIKYKLQLQEKNNIINNLIKEINYYKNGLNNINRNNSNLNKNLSKKNIFAYSPQNQNNINHPLSILKNDKDSNKFKQFLTLDNEHRKNSYKINSPKKNNIISILINDNNSIKNDLNIFKKYNNKFPDIKKNKLMQKKYTNLTQDNNKYENINISKINKLDNLKLNGRNNTLEYNNNKINKSEFYLINSSNSNSISKDNGNFNFYNEQEAKIEELEKRMKNLICNLFSIIETNKK